MRHTPLLLLLSLCVANCYSNSTYSNADLGGTRLWANAVNLALNGNAEATLTVAVAQSAGNAVADVGVQFAQTGCVLQNQASVTDANGEIQVHVTCTGVGQRLLTPTVVLSTLNQPLSLQVPLNFYTPADGNRAVTAGLALNHQLHLAADYRGTVHFSSSDANATLPADYTFTAHDLGIHQFSNAVILRTLGQQSLQVADSTTGAHLDSATYDIRAPAGADLRFDADNAAATAGQQVGFNLRAVDASGATAASYTGTVTFTSTDPAALLPAPYTYKLSDTGVHHFETYFHTAGTANLAVSDGTLGSRMAFSVGAGAATQVRIDAPSTVLAGDALTATATTLDTYGNAATTYTGALHMSCSDANAQFTANAITVQGVARFTNVQLRSAGPQTLDIGNSADLLNGSSITTVVATTPVRLQVDANSTAQAGDSLTVTVTARDAYGNAASSYTGTVRLSGTDAGAIYPGTYTFGTVDAGAHAFAGLSLVKAGDQIVQASDLAVTSIRGQTAVQVAALGPFGLALTGLPASTVAGTQIDLNVAGVDAYGNLATGYQGTVHLQSSDSGGSVQGDTAFAPDANGVMHLPQAAQLVTAGPQTLRVSDTAGTLVTGSGALTVIAANANSLRLGGLSSQVYQFATQSVQVTALDAYGNVADSYAGVVHFSSSDANANLPANGRLLSGTANLQLVLNTVGDNQNVTVTDTVNPLSATTTLGVVHQCMPYGSLVMTPSWTYGTVLAVDSNNMPAAAFYDASSGSGQTYARIFDGSGWTGVGSSSVGGGVSALVGAGCANGSSSPVGVLFDPNNVLTVAYMGNCNGQNAALLARYQTSDTSGLAGSNLFPGVRADAGGAALAQTPDGHAAMLVQDNNGLLLLIYDGAAWTPLGGGYVPTRGGVGGYLPALDTNNRAYVAYSYNFNGEYDVYLTAFDGNSWTELAGSNSGGGISNNSGGSGLVGLAINPNHQPVVAWTDDSAGAKNVWVRMFNGTSWVDYGGSGSGTGASGQSSGIDAGAMALDSQGKPWVAWNKYLSNSEEVFFKHWDGSAWVGIYGSDVDLGVTQMGYNPGMPGFSFILDHADRPIFGWSTWYAGVGRICHWL